MREFLSVLSTTLETVCPTFVHVPPKTPYPYITLEPAAVLKGVPWGPQIATFSVKIWSRYAGTIEILKLAKGVEELLQSYEKTSLIIRESSLEVLSDGQTRRHTFKVKARLKEIS